MSFLQKYIFEEEKDVNGFEINAYNQMINTIGRDVLDKYNYKLATFWHIFNLSHDEVQQLHPIVFIHGINRNHFLPNEILCSLNPEQIYTIVKGKVKTTSYASVDDYIIRIWQNTCQGKSLSQEYLLQRKIPVWTNQTFPENLFQLYMRRVALMKEKSKIKPLQFYLDTQRINIKDFCMLMFSIKFEPDSHIAPIIRKVFHDAFITDNVMDYNKTLEILNKNYWYRKLIYIEEADNLNTVARKIFYDYFNGYYKVNRDVVLRKIVYMFENREETNKIPHFQLSERKFVYFYQDVADYCQKEIFKTNK